ncbi:hypothetical protein D3C81_457810 [compost metagenome]
MRLAAGEQTLLARRHGGDANRRKRLLDARGFFMRTHQHRDITRLHRLAIDLRATFARCQQHPVDIRDTSQRGRIA